MTKQKRNNFEQNVYEEYEISDILRVISFGDGLFTKD